jgi:formate-dependent nitrite reductase membrane component NrfD
MKTLEWGFLIIIYLFLGGLSAGLFFVSALATLLHPNGEDASYQRIARLGALLAPWPVMLGCLLLVFDLGRWYRFWKLFLHFRWVSPMSIGSWLLVAFTLIALLYLYSWLSAQDRGWLFSRLPNRLAFVARFNRDLSTWRRRLALLGAPISIGVGIYTGVLLGAVQSRPFWNTNLVAQLFLFSALSTGCAALILALAWKQEWTDRRAFQFLYSLDISLLTLEFFIVVPYIIHGQLSVQAVRDSLRLILGGPFTVTFWVFFLGMGLLLPLGIESYEAVPAFLSRKTAHFHRGVATATAVLVLSGGFVLRYIFVFAGQMSAFK